MRDADDYKWFANDCLKRANRADSDQQRKSLIGLAKTCLRLAEEAANSHDSSMPPDKSVAVR